MKGDQPKIGLWWVGGSVSQGLLDGRAHLRCLLALFEYACMCVYILYVWWRDIHAQIYIIYLYLLGVPGVDADGPRQGLRRAGEFGQDQHAGALLL